MAIKMIDAYKCSDGKVFEDERAAKAHEDVVVCSAIDKAMKGLMHVPTIHYGNLSVDLIPYMKENAAEIIAALKMEVEDEQVPY